MVGRVPFLPKSYLGCCSLLLRRIYALRLYNSDEYEVHKRINLKRNEVAEDYLSMTKGGKTRNAPQTLTGC